MLSRKAALAAVPIFQGLAPEVLEAVLSKCQQRAYSRNETVFLEGEPTRGLIVVRSGAVKVYKVGAGGREQILEIEGPGRSVAELPLFDGEPYPASCASIEDSLLLTMPAEAFHRLVDGHPELARSVIASLSRRLRQMVGLVEEISLKAVRSRLAGLLLEMAGERDRIELQLTHQEIAARIGTVREIVSRTLTRMARDGAIRLDPHAITLIDRRKL
jgi:CRP/FNR family transcriptional regulator